MHPVTPYLISINAAHSLPAVKYTEQSKYGSVGLGGLLTMLRVSARGSKFSRGLLVKILISMSHSEQICYKLLLAKRTGRIGQVL